MPAKGSLGAENISYQETRCTNQGSSETQNQWDTYYLYYMYIYYLCTYYINYTITEIFIIYNKYNSVCLFLSRDLWLGIDPHDFGVWKVPRSAVGKWDSGRLVVPAWGQGTENQENHGCQFQCEGRRKPVSQLNSQASRGPSYSGFLVYSGLHLIEWDPLMLGRAICFSQSDLDTFSLETTSETHSESCLTKWLGSQWPTQVDTWN